MAEASDKKLVRDPRTTCGWCGKSEADGVQLVAGPITNICAQCCRLVAGALRIIPPEMAFAQPIEQPMSNDDDKQPERSLDVAAEALEAIATMIRGTGRTLREARLPRPVAVEDTPVEEPKK